MTNLACHILLLSLKSRYYAKHSFHNIVHLIPQAANLADFLQEFTKKTKLSEINKLIFKEQEAFIG